MTSEALLPGVQVEGDGRVKWFQPFGSVERRDDGVSHVYIGGVLIGSFRGTPCMSPVLPCDGWKSQAVVHDGNGIEVDRACS